VTGAPLRDRLRAALPPAMKARDRDAVAALRSALAAIENAEAVAPPAPAPLRDGVIPGATAGLGSGEAVRVDLSEDRVAAIVRGEVDERRSAAADYARAGQDDRAARLTAEADVLAAHLGG
jgi:uncharacterized protein YqeY